MQPAQLSVLFFLELFAIVAAARIVGCFGKRFFGQPQVVGEMIAGVLLGPSLFGLIFPHLERALFPTEAKSVLYVGAQLGVGLYMFLVGLGFDRGEFKAKFRSATAVSISGMAAPFLLAVLITPWLVRQPGLISGKLSLGQASLFI